MAHRIVTPEWVKDAVFYQIFPDRFAQSDKVPKPRNLQPWGSQPTGHGYQGGDLLGVVEHLDDLADLGITAIYFTPVFQSASNHRYHTHDYFRVDPLLGGNAALRTLVTEAHRRGMRMVLDGVFNHASRGFFQFNDILENGAESPWLDWFTVEKWPLHPYEAKKPANYAAWWGQRALPRLNTDNPEVREFIMRVAEFWLREYDIDGWRLDVPMEITAPGFWQEFRRRVKAVKPEAYIVGEVWTEAKEWLKGDKFDAVMNYQLAAAMIAYAGGERVSEALVKGKPYKPYPGIKGPEFARRLRHIMALYDWQITQVQLNLLDSHDTARVVSLARGDVATLRLATMLQMTLPGAPCVYYGDEVGIRGSSDYDQPFRDQDARWAYPWARGQDAGLRSFFKQIIQLRHNHRVLRRGQISQVHAHGECCAFVRQDDTERVVVAVNTATEPRAVSLPIDARFREGQDLRVLFGHGSASLARDGHIRMSLPAREGMVLGQ